MAELGIMIEGQEDLTWDRFFRIAEAVEQLGLAFLFRSDHLTALNGNRGREALATWPSLTALALRTQRIRFGPMVCSMTFRHPSMVAKMAASVDVLSGGRLDLGLGAGWHAGEHAMFGINYPAYGTRLEMLDEGATVIKGLWSGQPTTFTGKHYRLETAENYPLPKQSTPTLIMGGKGEKTLQIVAKHATEWNCAYSDLNVFREKSAELDGYCRAINRDPATLRRSVMLPFVIGRDEAAIQNHIDAHRETFPDLPASLVKWQAAGFPGGTPVQLIEQLKAFEAAGVSRFMLQQNALDDIESLELLATEVLPALSP
ncbi:MAG: LLM class flavin-dependent oxidoreductase [Anaerolineae bacterium]|nr:LLM class flavin-dependent oxidoreductase [Anaerolineae bacterium]